MQAIETWFDGYRFRSRTEARWAVFFKAAEIKFQYEPEGYVLNGTRYLPDFYLPEEACWFEVKGQYPTAKEQEISQVLAVQTKKSAFIAIGEPRPDCWLIEFQSITGERVTLQAEKLGYLIGHDRVDKGFAAARSARFEHGESGGTEPPRRTVRRDELWRLYR